MRQTWLQGSGQALLSTPRVCPAGIIPQSISWHPVQLLKMQAAPAAAAPAVKWGGFQAVG